MAGRGTGNDVVMSDEQQRDVPTGLPDPAPGEDPRRGEHNELGFFSQDENRAADETSGHEEQAEGAERGVAAGEPAPLDPDDTEH